MFRRFRSLVVLFLVAGVLVAAPASADRPADAGSAADGAKSAVDFWTHERVAKAIPRDFVFEPGRGFVPYKPGGNKPDNPGNGNNDKPKDEDPPQDLCSGGVIVDGESWTCGGEVNDTTGKILFQMGSSYYVCSGSVVTDGSAVDGESLIVTAAHCVFDERSGEFAKNWVFIPNYDATPEPLSTDTSLYCPDTLYGCWEAEFMGVHEQYAGAGGFNDTAVVYDFGVVSVGPGGKTAGGELDGVAGSQSISFSTDATSGEAYAFGYPAAKKYKGDDLVYCAATPGTDPYLDPPSPGDETYRLEPCDMTGGSSGGPWFSSFEPSTGIGTLSSLNSYGYNGVNAMHGPVFDGDAEAVFGAVDTRDTDRTDDVRTSGE